MDTVYSYLDDFLSLFFPDLCAACRKNLLKNESLICTHCIYHLPYTNFHHQKDNRVARQLWGRVAFDSAAAFLHFRKGSRVQNLLHQLKYNNKPEIALRLGEMYGFELKQSAGFMDSEIIVPVPLHPKRLKVRGYNQSDHFAQGLSNTMGIPMDNLALKRIVSTSTQTKRSRFSRYENMIDVFEIGDPASLQGKKILLIDDVITTGATLEACALKILELEKTALSIATIAFSD